MSDKEDFHRYLDTRFEGLTKVMSANFINVHDKLDAIEKQTTKSNCRITKIEDDLTEYRMIKKYPKVAIMVIAIAVLSVIYAFRNISQKQNVLQETQGDLKTQVDMINTPIKDIRSGKTYLYPSGMLIDSIITK